MKKRPFLLLTNDDGIHAHGIKHLWQAISEHADVAIVAPQSEKSGCGMSITWTQPLHIQEIPWESGVPAWCMNGTPADCVKMALAVLLDRKPDAVISGINRGSNAGRTVLYSGTVGGVIEGSFKNIPGIAFSFTDLVNPPLEITKPYIWPIIEYILNHPLPKGTFLNVNFPLNAKEQIKGLKMARQGKTYWVESPERRIHPEGLPYYWLGGKWAPSGEDADTDVACLQDGYISAVPIHVGELTDREVLESRKTSLEALFSGDASNRL